METFEECFGFEPVKKPAGDAETMHVVAHADAEFRFIFGKRRPSSACGDARGPVRRIGKHPGAACRPVRTAELCNALIGKRGIRVEAIVAGGFRELLNEGLQKREIVFNKCAQIERPPGTKFDGAQELPLGGLERKMTEAAVGGERRIVKRSFSV